MQQKERNFIQSRYIGFKVDGFCEETNTVYEFDGCHWHGCDVCNTNRNADGNLREMHPIKNIPFSEIRKTAQEKKRALAAKGFRMVSVRECEWMKIKRQQDIASLVKSLKCVQPKRQLPFKRIFERCEK